MTVSFARAQSKSWINKSLSQAVARLHPCDDKDLIEDLIKIAGLADIHIGCEAWHNGTNDIVENVSAIDTLKHLELEVQRVRSLLGVQHVMIASVKEVAVNLPRYRMLTTWPDQWVQEYVEEMYQRRDPIYFEELMKQPMLLHELEILPPLVADYLKKAQRAGIGPSGMICWTEISEGTVVAVVLTSNAEPVAFEETLERMGWDLFIVADALARAFARATGMISPDPRTLSDAELTLLRAIATGASHRLLPEFSGDGGCVPKSPSLNQKLGTNDLMQAAITIASTGILTFAPLQMDEIWIADIQTSRRSRRRSRGKPPLVATQSHKPMRALATPLAYGVRKYLHGWAVFRNSERVTDVFTCEREANRACRQVAWSSEPCTPVLEAG